MKLPDLDFRLFLPRPPFVLIAVAVIGLVASWVPLALFLKHRFSYHAQPRIHLFQDMDNQPRLEAQGATPLFTDHRAMRPTVPGTVARGHLDQDDHFTRGFLPTGGGDDAGTEYLAGFPESIDVDEAFVRHGRERYDAMCAVCHGLDGQGQGMVNQSASALMVNKDATISRGTAWAPAANLLAENETTGGLLYGPAAYPEGKLFNTITVGKGNMTGYGHAIPPQDRWAIVAYIRALQLAQKPDAVQAAWATEDAPRQVAEMRLGAGRFSGPVPRGE